MNAESCPTDSEAKLRYLQAALAPAPGGEAVRRLETHMSWLLLGGDKVLKLKRPVRYPFLDFSTVQARERDAREEIRVNRRLAPGIYLGLLALQWNEGAFSLVPEDRLPAPGQTIDWLVAMRRLPAERMLDHLIARHMLNPDDVEALLGVLVPFYRQARRCPIAEDDYVDRLRAEIAVDRDVLTLPRLGLQPVDALLERMERALAVHDGLLRQRVRERRIVEGHGDLRPEHVCLVDPPVVIDALEFDVRLREIDPFDELCFLGLECAMAGDAGIGPLLLARCADALDDHPGAPLLQLYAARRALLRARLSAAHLLDAPVRAPERWLPQTRRYLVKAGDALRGFDAGDGR
jgi:aminoglycoside phosphotransferase family enzyme